MSLGEALAAVRERDVQLHDEVAVPWLIHRAARTVASLDDPEERQCGELPLGVALLDTRPHSGTLWRVLTEGERMQEAKSSRIGDTLETGRGTLVLFVAGPLEQGGVAREEVQVPAFDGHFATAQTRPTTALS